MEKKTMRYFNKERGATAIFVVLVFLPLVALTALAIDIGHLAV